MDLDEGWLPRAAGAVAAGAGLAVTEVVHGLSSGTPSLVAVVSQAVIRRSPGSASRTAIDSVGTNDKPLLVATVVVVTILLGALVGPLARRRPLAGDAAFAAGGLVAVAAAASLDGVPVGSSAVAAVLAAGVGAAALRLLVARLPAPIAPGGAPPPGPRAVPGQGVDRRRFLQAASAAGVGSAFVAVTGWGLTRSRGPAARVEVVLPEPPASSGPPPSAADLGVDGLSALVTPNDRFYRIDEALVVPSVDPSTWRLKVTGMVDHPFELSLDDLFAEPVTEAIVTLSCVSNEVGGTLVGNAVWRGARLDRLLERAGVQPGATQVVGRSVDGFTVGFPVEAATDGRDALVAYGMNGVPLPYDHGFPARLVVPGLYGYVSATKWLSEIELTTFDRFDAYWVERGWSQQAPIKVQSRVDVPRNGSRPKAGRQAIAGVAWAPRRGIGKVEVKLDAGEWVEARLSDSLGADAWRQWVLDAELTEGTHRIEVRATTADGEVQTDADADVFPDGATGHHHVNVRVVAA